MLLLSQANAFRIPLPDESIQCVVTSPPYFGLRNYDVDGQIGLEETPEEYVADMVAVFREVWRVLRKDGVVWLNLGDSYASQGGPEPAQTKWLVDGASNTQNSGMSRIPPTNLRPKNLIGIPWRVAFALQADGWYLRSDIIWAKGVSGQKETEAQIIDAIHRALPPGIARYVIKRLMPELDLWVGGCMPESVRDRPTKSHEYVFLLTKNKKYYYDKWAIVEPAKDWGTRDRTNFRMGTDDPKLKHHGLTDSNHLSSGRNRRSVWQINTKPFKGAHFATFPPGLIRPMILAGTSERGCCANCGASWKRVVKGPGTGPQRGSRKHEQTRLNRFAGQQYQNWRNENPDTAEGWKQTCECDCHDTVPCLVLDPFVGSGTTALVSGELGRRCVGLDLSYSYLHDQAMDRLRNTS